MPHDDAGKVITVWVGVPAAAHEAAEALAKTHAGEGLEEVLAAFALDLADLRAGKGGLRLSWVLGWLVCADWPRGGKEGA